MCEEKKVDPRISEEVEETVSKPSGADRDRPTTVPKIPSSRHHELSFVDVYAIQQLHCSKPVLQTLTKFHSGRVALKLAEPRSRPLTSGCNPGVDQI